MDIRAVFSTLPGNNVLVQPDAPTFTVLAATTGYLQATGRTEKDLVGKGLFEEFPNNPADENQTSEKTVRASIEYALLHKEPHYLPVQRYDVATETGVYEERYWAANNKPLLNDEGEVVYLIHSVEEVTDKLNMERREIR